VKTARPTRPIYRDENPAEIPAYTIPEAAQWLGVASSTVRAWLLGQGSFEAVVEIADRASKTLSFRNLVELHVLAAIRRKHNVSLQRVRRAVDFMERSLAVPHPLSSARMLTDGRDLLVEACGNYLNVSRSGQGEMRQILQAYLERIEHDSDGVPARLYPFTRKDVMHDPRSVVIDPLVEFGRPCLAATGIPTVEVADRYKAGESIDSIAGDYGRAREQIEEAIRYELPVAA
jgi:uncharacterized protein (DUF433 family)